MKTGNWVSCAGQDEIVNLEAITSILLMRKDFNTDEVELAFVASSGVAPVVWEFDNYSKAEVVWFHVLKLLNLQHIDI